MIDATRCLVMAMTAAMMKQQQLLQELSDKASPEPP